MIRIISFTDYYYPGYKAGGTIRAFLNQVEYLKDQFEFYIVTRNTDYTENVPYEGIVPDTWTGLSENVHVYYFSQENIKASVIKKLLNERPYDVVYIHLLFGFWFSMLPLYLAKKKGFRKIVVAAHGNLGAGALSVKSARKKIYLNLARILGVYRNVVFHSVTPHETDDIRQHIGPKTNIIEARELPRKISSEPVRSGKKAGALRMVTVARIAPEKNQMFALRFLKQCTANVIHYDLIGPVYDEAYWQECQSVVRELPSNIVVNYRGSIHSEMIPSELQSYDVMLLPTTGENFGHTILESFMAGCPVIISDRTPWKQLEKAMAGREIPLEEPERFVSAVNEFAAMEPAVFEQWSKSAFAFALQYLADSEMLAENVELFSLQA